MGEESITVPPALKKACITSVNWANACGSFGVSKVRDVPIPITGIGSPELGMARVISGRSAPLLMAECKGIARAANKPAPNFTTCLRLIMSPLPILSIFFESCGKLQWCQAGNTS
jgi:hypothetical protein